MSKKALINVDLQNDFFPGGALGVPKGDEIIEVVEKINKFAGRKKWLRIKTRDWHPEETKHFQKNGGIWPVHCVQNTKGAEFKKELNANLYGVLDGAIEISKGMNMEDNGYSGFDGETEGWEGNPSISLEKLLKLNGIEAVYVLGLATDYCVKATALDAVRFGFQTYVLIDACRAVNIHPDDEVKAIEEMKQAGVIITTTEEVMNAK